MFEAEAELVEAKRVASGTDHLVTPLEALQELQKEVKLQDQIARGEYQPSPQEG